MADNIRQNKVINVARAQSSLSDNRFYKNEIFGSMGIINNKSPPLKESSTVVVRIGRQK